MKPGLSTYLYEKPIIILFLLMVFLPPIKMLVTPATDWSNVEKRKLADLPRFPLSTDLLPPYLNDLEHYLEDHFGFRDYLIFRYHQEKKKRFGVKGIKEKVLQGKDGWLFFAPQALLLDFQGKKHLEEETLLAWVSEQNSINTWLTSLGIRYLLVVPPDKQSVYPEFLPPDFARLNGISRYEQLMQFLTKRPLTYLLDLHLPIIQAKSGGHFLFYKNDTHWNARGAYIAFNEIANSLQKLFPGVELTREYTFTEDQEMQCRDFPALCDLSVMALTHEESSEMFPVFESSVPPCASPVDLSRYADPAMLSKSTQPSFARECPRKQLKIIVFCDSFIAALEPFLSENFAEILYLRTPYNQQDLIEIIKHFKPDLVINERVERDLFN